jgi:hypothetical protein
MNDFRRDNSGQRRVRDAVLVPFLYKNISMDGRFVLCDKGRFADILQRRMDVDTIVERENGLVAIEEKIVRWGGRKYTAVTLETDSCTIPGYETDGWMHYCEADKLLWVMCQGDGTVVYHVFGFPELQKVFWEAMEENDNIFTPHTEKHNNKTRSRIVDIGWIKSKDVPYAEGVIDPGEEGRQIVREYNLQKRAYL